MTQDTTPKRTKIPLKSFLADYKSSLDDGELMGKYGLTVTNFIGLIRTLTQKNILTAGDRELRKRLVAEKALAKETTFLKSLFLCANCGHPHPTKFDVCPACGADQTEFGAGEDATDHISTTGGHFYVPEPAAPESKAQPASPARGIRPTEPKPDESKAPPVMPEEPKPEAEKAEPPKKRSAIDSIRSLFSRDKSEKSDKK